MHNVRTHYNGTKTFHHPEVGDLVLAYDVMEFPGSAGVSLTAYTVEPATKSADNLALLASWAATNVAHARQRSEHDSTDRPVR
jgi:hypothetical protein